LSYLIATVVLSPDQYLTLSTTSGLDVIFSHFTISFFFSSYSGVLGRCGEIKQIRLRTLLRCLSPTLTSVEWWFSCRGCSHRKPTSTDVALITGRDPDVLETRIIKWKQLCLLLMNNYILIHSPLNRIYIIYHVILLDRLTVQECIHTTTRANDHKMLIQSTYWLAWLLNSLPIDEFGIICQKGGRCWSHATTCITNMAFCTHFIFKQVTKSFYSEIKSYISRNLEILCNILR
jgi:hypothetical protein